MQVWHHVNAKHLLLQLKWSRNQVVDKLEGEKLPPEVGFSWTALALVLWSCWCKTPPQEAYVCALWVAGCLCCITAELTFQPCCCSVMTLFRHVCAGHGCFFCLCLSLEMIKSPSACYAHYLLTRTGPSRCNMTTVKQQSWIRLRHCCPA